MTRPTFGPQEQFLDHNGNAIYGLIVRQTIRQTAITLGNTITKLLSASLSPRIFLFVFNNSGDIIYVGDSTVTTLNGFPIYPRSGYIFNMDDNIDLYGISAGTASDIRLMEGA